MVGFNLGVLILLLSEWASLRAELDQPKASQGTPLDTRKRSMLHQQAKNPDPKCQGNLTDCQAEIGRRTLLTN